MDITSLTLDELKVLAFDEILKRDQAQNNLNILQAEMQKRVSIPLEEKKIKKEKKSHVI